MRVLTMVVTTLAAGTVVLTGCSTGSGSGSGGAESAKLDAPAAARGSAAGGARAAAGKPTAGSEPLISSADGRSLIRTAELSVRVKAGTSVAAQANRADEIAAAAGGEVFGDDRTSGRSATAALTLKVPPDALAQVLNQLSGLGKELSRSLSTQDVTGRVADVGSRVHSARASIARLRALYAHAVKVGDIIAIEGELAGREADLESLESQQRALAAQTSMATVQLSLTAAAPAPVHRTHTDRGIGAALANGWRHFTDAAGWLVTALATLLPFLALALLVGGAVRLGWRRRAVPTPAPTPGEPA